MAVELEELIVKDAAEWRAWLEKNGADSPGVWLVLHKKGGNVTELDYAAALDECLCFGWIDGQGRRRDDESVFQRMTRRGPKSPWSKRNVGHIARLEAEGKRPDGPPSRAPRRTGAGKLPTWAKRTRKCRMTSLPPSPRFRQPKRCSTC